MRKEHGNEGQHNRCLHLSSVINQLRLVIIFFQQKLEILNIGENAVWTGPYEIKT